MMGESTGKIMPADGVRPCFDKRFDLTFGRSALQHHGSRSDCLPMYLPRTNVRVHIRHAEQLFLAHDKSVECEARQSGSSSRRSTGQLPCDLDWRGWAGSVGDIASRSPKSTSLVKSIQGIRIREVTRTRHRSVGHKRICAE